MAKFINYKKLCPTCDKDLSKEICEHFIEKINDLDIRSRDYYNDRELNCKNIKLKINQDYIDITNSDTEQKILSIKKESILKNDTSFVKNKVDELKKVILILNKIKEILFNSSCSGEYSAPEKTEEIIKENFRKRIQKENNINNITNKILEEKEIILRELKEIE